MEYFYQETVRNNMASPAKTVDPEMTLSDLLRLFGSNDFAAYPVVRDGKLVGIVSRADSIGPFSAKAGTNTACFDAIMGTTVDQIMSWHVTAVDLDATLDTVVHLMGAHDFESFPVVDQERRVRGIISRQDLIRALARYTWRASPQPLPLSPMGYAIA
jgi:CBS domain-containing protein